MLSKDAYTLFANTVHDNRSLIPPSDVRGWLLTDAEVAGRVYLELSANREAAIYGWRLSARSNRPRIIR
jgi:hypothetical protein